ncbi:hypothetical protein C8J56DRAFT_1063766 [Mycena floridula]|nr:hypothetical protein C8J56DRAFT_1063766 [Mycena floridula]
MELGWSTDSIAEHTNSANSSSQRRSSFGLHSDDQIPSSSRCKSRIALDFGLGSPLKDLSSSAYRAWLSLHKTSKIRVAEELFSTKCNSLLMRFNAALFYGSLPGDSALLTSFLTSTCGEPQKLPGAYSIVFLRAATTAFLVGPQSRRSKKSLNLHEDTFSSLADLHYLRSESSIECICNKIFLSSSLASTKFVFCFIPGTNSSEIANDATDAGHPDMSGPISHPPITSIESSNPVGELEKDELDEDFGFDLTLLTNIDNDAHPLPADPAPATPTETPVDSGGHNLRAKVKFDAEHKDLGFLAGRRSLPHSSTGLVPPLTEHRRSPTKTTRQTPTEVASVTSPEPNVSRPSSSTIPERQGQQWTKAQMDVINRLDPKLRACFAVPSPPPSSPPPIVPALSLGPSISTTAFFNSFKSKTVSETSPSPVPSLPKTKAYFANAARRLAGLSPLPGTPLPKCKLRQTLPSSPSKPDSYFRILLRTLLDHIELQRPCQQHCQLQRFPQHRHLSLRQLQRRPQLNPGHRRPYRR